MLRINDSIEGCAAFVRPNGENETSQSDAVHHCETVVREPERSRRGRRSLLLLMSFGVSVTLGLNACGSDTTAPAPLTSAQVFWTLQLNQHAVTLALTAPIDTIYLHVVSLNPAGDSLPQVGRVQYTSSDSTIIVDSTGLVTAKYVSKVNKTSFVVASLTDSAQSVTLVDTCFIRVTATAPEPSLASVSIQPAQGDSAIRPSALGVTLYTVKPVAAGSDNNAFMNFFAYFTSSDPNIATIDRLTGAVRAILAPSQVTLYAQTWAYGVARRDSLQFTITYPVTGRVDVLRVVQTGSRTAVLTFWPQTVTVGVGATVSWSNSSYTDSVDVIFDDPTNVDSTMWNLYQYSTGRGDIAPWAADSVGASGIDSVALQGYIRYWKGEVLGKRFYRATFNGKSRSRVFPVAGTYHYHSKRYGYTGTIEVR